MKIKTEDISILKSFGYTGREAGFLYLVAIHSGYFTQCQFTEFGSITPGGVVTAFTNKLLARGHASEHRYQNNAHVFHFNYKGMYSAIDREDLRNRRAHTFEYMKSRLAILDFVLGHLEPDYLEGEVEKVQYFEGKFQIQRKDMPGRTYRGANKDPDTIRYFVDKFPLFLDSTQKDEPRITLTFIGPGTGNFKALKTHLNKYSLFLSRIPRFTFLFANPDARTFTTAETMFRNAMHTSSTILSEQLARYFKLRADWEAGRYGLLKVPDIEYLNRSRKRFSEKTYERTFAEWKAGRLTQTDLGAVIQNQLQPSQEVEFKTYQLPRDYSSFGQNSQFCSRIP
jgi:hypothetical protein